MTDGQIASFQMHQLRNSKRVSHVYILLGEERGWHPVGITGQSLEGQGEIGASSHTGPDTKVPQVWSK